MDTYLSIRKQVLFAFIFIFAFFTATAICAAGGPGNIDKISTISTTSVGTSFVKSMFSQDTLVLVVLGICFLALIFSVGLILFTIKRNSRYKSTNFLKNMQKSMGIRRKINNYRSIMATSPLPCSVWDMEGNCIESNPSLFQMFGLADNTGKFSRQLFWQLTPKFQPDGVPSVTKATIIVRNVMKKGLDREEFLCHMASGDPLPLEITVVRMGLAGQYMMAVYYRDLREVKAREAAALEAEERMYVMLNDMILACVFWTADGQVLDCNNTALDIFGCKDKTEFKNNFLSYSPEYQPGGAASVEYAKQLVQMVYKTGQSMREHWIHQTADGQAFPTEVHLMRVKWKDDYSVLANIRDLREINAIQEDLSRMSAIVEASPEAALYLNHEGRIEYMNEAVSAISGYTREEFMAFEDPFAVILAADTLQKLKNSHIPRALQQERVDFETHIINKNGEKRFIAGFIFSSKMHNGQSGLCLLIRDVTEKKRLESLSITDGLTSISNRRNFDAQLKYLWEQAVRKKMSIALLMLDIDNFKSYNDHYGHVEGDKCIKAVAAGLVKSLLRTTDFVARYGGEEFAVIVSDVDNEGILILANRILNNIEAMLLPHAVSAVSAYVTVSIGGATMNPTLDDAQEELIRRADVALYQSKQTGKNKFTVYDL